MQAANALSDLEEGTALSSSIDLEVPRKRETEHQLAPSSHIATEGHFSASRQVPNHESARLYQVALFCSTTALLFADQSLLAPNVRQPSHKASPALLTMSSSSLGSHHITRAAVVDRCCEGLGAHGQGARRVCPSVAVCACAVLSTVAPCCLFHRQGSYLKKRALAGTLVGLRMLSSSCLGCQQLCWCASLLVHDCCVPHASRTLQCKGRDNY